MDDFRLKVFLTAARTLSFTRTAEQLFVRRGIRLESTEAEPVAFVRQFMEFAKASV